MAEVAADPAHDAAGLIRAALRLLAPRVAGLRTGRGDCERFRPGACAPRRSRRTRDRALRPQTLGEFIGQGAVRANLAVFIESARRRGEPMDHTLFYGPPGLGKTTLAQIMARELGRELPHDLGAGARRAPAISRRS